MPAGLSIDRSRSSPLNLIPVFNDVLIPTARVLVEAPGGNRLEVAMLFDTGFNHAVSLTKETVNVLGPALFDETITVTFETAAGPTPFRTCNVSVIIDGVRKNHVAVINNVNALGNEFFRGCTISFTVEPGSNVQIT